MAHPDLAALEQAARWSRVQILRMLAHAGSGHPGGSLSVIDLLTVLYFRGLYAKHGLDPDGIAASVRRFLER